jgi:hypothetical protein
LSNASGGLAAAVAVAVAVAVAAHKIARIHFTRITKITK